MLDPTRFALDAATVGFRKRMRQSVDWGAFNQALQTETDSIKVRRELEETPITELHVMGAQRFGLEGNGKTNEYARQQRQMNGYVLRSFLADGGPIIRPQPNNNQLLGIPTTFGQVQYTPNAVQGQQYTSAFTEPLNEPLENNTILLGRAGIEAKSDSLTNPYKALQFQLNIGASQDQIRQVEQDHADKKDAAFQADLRRQIEIQNAPVELRPIVSLLQQRDEMANRGRGPAKPPRPTRRNPRGEYDGSMSGTQPVNRLTRREVSAPSGSPPKPPKPTQEVSAPSMPPPKPPKPIQEDQRKIRLEAAYEKPFMQIPLEQQLQQEQQDREREAAEILSRSKQSETRAGFAVDAASLQNEFSISENDALFALIVADDDFELARQTLRAELAGRSRSDTAYASRIESALGSYYGSPVTPGETMMASRLDSLLDDADDPRQYSVYDFNSRLGSFIDRTNITPSVKLKSGLVLNDTGEPVSDISAGYNINWDVPTGSSRAGASPSMFFTPGARADGSTLMMSMASPNLSPIGGGDTTPIRPTILGARSGGETSNLFPSTSLTRRGEYEGSMSGRVDLAPTFATPKKGSKAVSQDDRNAQEKQAAAAYTAWKKNLSKK